MAGHSGSHREVTAPQVSVPQAHPWFQEEVTVSWGWVELGWEGHSQQWKLWNKSWSTKHTVDLLFSGDKLLGEAGPGEVGVWRIWLSC